MDIGIVGNVSRDTVWLGDKKIGPFVGGAGFNVAIAVARSGIRPRLISTIGMDNRGLLNEIDQLVDTSSLAVLEGKTCAFEIRYSEEGTFKDIQCLFGVSKSLNEHVRNIALGQMHHHICCRKPLDPEPILARLYLKGCSFSLDFIVSSVVESVTRCQRWIPYAECVFVNSAEFAVLREHCDLNKIKLLVITAANKPVTIFRYGEQVCEYPCPPCEVYEVTGAGDTLAGTFLAQHLIKKQPLDVSIAKAVASAQSILGRPGVWN